MAIKANLLIDQGADFATTINVTDDDGGAIDLTNYTGEAQMRKHYTSSTYYSFDVSMGGSSGEVTLSLSSNTTDSITPGRYVYDCELTDIITGIKSRLVEGIVTITPQVTR
jgi:hypothetical protein